MLRLKDAEKLWLKGCYETRRMLRRSTSRRGRPVPESSTPESPPCAPRVPESVTRHLQEGDNRSSRPPVTGTDEYLVYRVHVISFPFSRLTPARAPAGLHRPPRSPKYHSSRFAPAFARAAFHRSMRVPKVPASCRMKTRTPPLPRPHAVPPRLAA